MSTGMQKIRIVSDLKASQLLGLLEEFGIAASESDVFVNENERGVLVQDTPRNRAVLDGPVAKAANMAAIFPGATVYNGSGVRATAPQYIHVYSRCPSEITKEALGDAKLAVKQMTRANADNGAVIASLTDNPFNRQVVGELEGKGVVTGFKVGQPSADPFAGRLKTADLEF